MPRSITPNLWFDTRAKEAAEYYCSVFPDSRILNVTHYNEAVPDKAGQVLTVDFELLGKRYTAINGGPEFTFSEAVSFMVEVKDQEELDHYWERLTDGGEEGPCGWCKDRYGLSWQVTPTVLLDYLQDKDPEKSQRVMQAMLQMQKIEIKPLQDAYARA